MLIWQYPHTGYLPKEHGEIPPREALEKSGKFLSSPSLSTRTQGWKAKGKPFSQFWWCFFTWDLDRYLLRPKIFGNSPGITSLMSANPGFWLAYTWYLEKNLETFNALRWSLYVLKSFFQAGPKIAYVWIKFWNIFFMCIWWGSFKTPSHSRSCQLNK